MKQSLATLNPNQLEAVQWNDGPLLVLAGPGSGKTFVLTLRIARLLEEDEDASILALTFTNKAAAEMRERVDRWVGQHAERVHLCTFHSFAADTLRQHGSHVGIRPDFILLTQDDDRIALLEPIIAELSENHANLPNDRKSFLNLLDRLFADSYDDRDTTSAFHGSPPWLPQLFTAYVRALLKSNRLDYGSLLYFATKLLSEKLGVARVIRLGWTHVCVDEFQDTNKAQYDLLRLLVDPSSPNLFVVGDDDQIIYQWNGASPERLQALRRDFSMEVVQLPENYRCPHEIVDLANKLIRHNRYRTSNKHPLVTARGPGPNGVVVRLLACDTEEDEVTSVAQDISARGITPGDCVVLARTSRLLDQAAEALVAQGIEAHKSSRKNDFEVPLVRLLFLSLRLSNARHDRDVLRRLCVAWEDFSGAVLEVDDVAAIAELSGGDFLRSWTDVVAGQAPNAHTADFVGRIRRALVDRIEFLEIVEWFFEEGWNRWSEEYALSLKEEVDLWRDLHEDLLGEHDAKDLTLNVYLQSMDLMSKVPRPPPNAVRCLTIHGSKGLEFKHVYLIGMAQEVFPSYQAVRRGLSSRELEEERRSCFVAITRARDTLTLCRARQYNGWYKRPSQFLLEMGIGNVDS